MAAKIISDECIFFKHGRKQYVGLVYECVTIWDVCIRHHKKFIVESFTFNKAKARTHQEALDYAIKTFKDRM